MILENEILTPLESGWDRRVIKKLLQVLGALRLIRNGRQVLLWQYANAECTINETIEAQACKADGKLQSEKVSAKTVKNQQMHKKC